MLELQGVSKRFGETLAVDNVSFACGRGEFVGIIGAKTVVRPPLLHFGFRRMLDVFRGVPALVWALIFVSAFGLGPFGGVLEIGRASCRERVCNDV